MRYLLAYGIFAGFCFTLYRVVGTVDSWDYWGPVLLAIGYGAALAWTTTRRV